MSPPVNQLRYHLYRDVLLRYPRRHACNLCGWRGRRFLSLVHRNVLCPSCGSQVRHRLIAAALAHRPEVAAAVRLVDGRVLHVSPEYCLTLLLKPRGGRYVRADFATSDADLRQDLTAMPFHDGSFDVVIACDVLEHIPRDRAALDEIRRVLRTGGTAVLSVPQFDEDRATAEDPRVSSWQERERQYGQGDHVRNYGSDFGTRLEQAGFSIRTVGAGEFATELQRRHVLVPPVPLAAPFGWNCRRVYFATKS